MYWNFLAKGTRFLPVEKLNRPVDKTSRIYFEAERMNFRLAKRLVEYNVPLRKRDYYLYKQTAQKYGWPYIKEVYDNQTESINEPLFRPAIRRVFSLKTRRRAFQLWWGFDVTICIVFLVVPPGIDLLEILSLQVYFVLIYILFKVIARQFKETPRSTLQIRNPSS